MTSSTISGDPGDQLDAFVSYARSDGEALPSALATGLERLAKRWNQRRSLRVFLDKESLGVGPSLPDQLRERLESAKWLVLVLGPGTRESDWVNREVAYWLENKSEGLERLLLVLVGGELEWDDAQGSFLTEPGCPLPPALVGRIFRAEPHYLDLRWAPDLPPERLDLSSPPFRDAVAQLAAPIHGIEKDELDGQAIAAERAGKRIRRAFSAAIAVFAAIASIAAVVAVLQRNDARDQRNRAIANFLVAESRIQVDVDPGLATALALEALDLSGGKAAGARGAVSAGFQALQGSEMSQAARIDLEGEFGLEVAISNSGSTVVVAGSGGAVTGFQRYSGGTREIDLAQHMHDRYGATSVEFLDENTVVSAGYDGQIQASYIDGRPSEVLLEISTPIYDISVDPASDMVAATTENGEVYLLEEVRTDLQVSLLQTDFSAWLVDLRAGGDLLAVGDEQGGVVLLDPSDGREVVSFAPDDFVSAMAFSDDGTMLAVAEAGGTTGLWTIGQEISRLQSFPTGLTLSTSFADGDATLLTAGDAGSIGRWSVASGQDVEPIRGHDGAAYSVASGNGRLVVSAGLDGSVRFWTPTSETTELAAFLGNLISVDHTEEGAVVGLLQGGRVLEWDATTQAQRTLLESTSPPATAIAVTSNGGYLAMGDETGAIRIYERPDMALRFSIDGLQESVETISFAEGDEIFVWTDSAGRLRRGSVLNTAAETIADTGFAGSPVARGVKVGEIVVAGDQDLRSVFRLPSSATKPIDLGIHHTNPIFGVDVHPDSGVGVSASIDGVVLVWDATGGDLLSEFQSDAAVRSVALDRAGEIAAVGSFDGSIQLFRVDSGQYDSSLDGHAKGTTGLHFLADEVLLSVGADLRARVWTTGPSAEVCAALAPLVNEVDLAQRMSGQPPKACSNQ